MAKDSIPTIPPVPPGLDPNLSAWLRALRDATVTRFGQTKNQLDRSPTLRELLSNGIISAANYDANGNPARLLPVGGVGGDPGYDPFADPSPPAAPINLAVASTPFTNRLTWDHPNDETRRKTAFTEVFGNSVDDLDTAVLLGIGNNSYVHAVDPSTTTYYWVRFRTYADIVGPFNALGGTEGTTPQDPSNLLQLLNGALAESALTATLNTRLNGIESNQSAISTISSTVDGVQAKYAVKVDVNGHVAGFGLISTANDAAPFSEFQIAVDRFSIRSPGATSLVFAVDGGAVVMDGAYIRNATIGNAKITDLSAAKINTGLLDAGRINLDGVTLENVGGQLRVREISANQVTTGLLNAARINLDGVSLENNHGQLRVKAINADLINAGLLSADRLQIGAVPQSANMLSNPGAELDSLLPHSVTTGGGTWSVVTTNPRSGLRCFQFSSIGQNSEAEIVFNRLQGVLGDDWGRVFSCSPGERYKASLWVRGLVSSNNNDVTLTLRWTQANGQVLLPTSVTFTPTGEYRQLTVQGVAPANAAFFRVHLTIQNQGKSGCLIDDVECFRSNLTGDSFPNLLVNPSAETSISDGWPGRHSSITRFEDHDGTGWQSLNQTFASGASLLNSTSVGGIPVTPGEWYATSAELLITGLSGSIYVDVIWMDAGGGTVVDGPNVPLWNANTHGWERRGHAYQAPSGAVWARVRLVTASNTSYTMVRARRFKFERSSEPTPYTSDLAQLLPMNRLLGGTFADFIEIASTGRVYSGKTTYASMDSGWWIGRDGGEPALHFGDNNRWIRYKPSTGLEQNNANLTRTASDYGSGSVLVTSDTTWALIASATIDSGGQRVLMMFSALGGPGDRFVDVEVRRGSTVIESFQTAVGSYNNTLLSFNVGDPNPPAGSQTYAVYMKKPSSGHSNSGWTRRSIALTTTA